MTRLSTTDLLRPSIWLGPGRDHLEREVEGFVYAPIRITDLEISRFAPDPDGAFRAVLEARYIAALDSIADHIKNDLRPDPVDGLDDITDTLERS